MTNRIISRIFYEISALMAVLVLSSLAAVTNVHAADDTYTYYNVNTYYIVNPRSSSGTLQVVSLADNNTIHAGNTVLTLDKNMQGVIPGSDLTAGTRIDATGAFSAGMALNGTDSPVPASLAGTRFVIPHFRNEHFYHLLSPYGDAKVEIRFGSGNAQGTEITLAQGQVQTVSGGSDNSLSAIIESNLPILIVHEARDGTGGIFDVYPVPPAAKEVWGVRSGSVLLGAINDQTTVKVYADDGSRTVYTLDAGSRLGVVLGNADTLQGAGSTLHIVADNPIAATQVADGDGSETTAFLNYSLLDTSYGIATDSQFVVVTCTQANTRVVLHEVGGTSQTRTCNGQSPLPGKVFFGDSTNGVHIAAGAVVEADSPIHVIAEDSATNDEHNVFGLLDEASTYYIVNPLAGKGALRIVSLVDNNSIRLGSTEKLTLDKNESKLIPPELFSPGMRISGTGPFSAGGEVDGTDTPLPATLAGTRFVIPHVRETHHYHLLSPYGDANVQINAGSAGVQTIAVYHGLVTSVDAGGDNSISATITSDLPILVVHQGQLDNTPYDVYPVPPAANTLWGIRSSSAWLGALEDNTKVTVYASSGEILTYTLNAGARQSIYVPAADLVQGQGPALYVVADKPVAAVQVADGDGVEATAFLNDKYLASHYGIPMDSQYVAVACTQANTLIRLHHKGGETEERICNAGGVASGMAISPGKAYFGDAINGMHIAAGSIVESSQPIYLIAEASSSNDEHNLFGRLAHIQAFDADAYYVVNPRLSQSGLSVISLSSHNSISAGNTRLELDKYETGSIPGIDLAPGVRIAGTGAFSAASAADGTDSPLPATLAGTRFVIPHLRGDHTYHMLSPYGDATVNISAGAASQAILLAQGQMQSVNAGGDNTLSAIINSDLPILIVHEGVGDGVIYDVYPVLPAATELWGIRSQGVWMGALENGTTVTVYADNGESQTYALDAGARVPITLPSAPIADSSQGQGPALHVVADKPVAVVQFADGDGQETTAFLDRVHLATHVGIAVDSQYVAVACTQVDSIVRLRSDLFIEEQLCPANDTIPGKVYFGEPGNGVHIPAGAVIEASRPVYVIAEASAANDEHNLFGRTGNDFTLISGTIEPDQPPDTQPVGYTHADTPQALQQGRDARPVNALGLFTLTNDNTSAGGINGTGALPGSTSGVAGSFDEWDETAVRRVLRTFAFGGLGVSDAQISEWAILPPEVAIEQMLTFDESNPLLTPPDALDDTWMNGGTIAAAANFWGSDASGNITPLLLKERFTANVPDQSGTLTDVEKTIRNESLFYWHRVALTPGLNPFRQYIGLWETNYHLAVAAPLGDNRGKLHFYDTVMEAHETYRAYNQVLAAAAKAPAVARHYGNTLSSFVNGVCQRCNEDFAREFHQLYFGIVGEGDPNYYENVTIKSTSLAFTGLRILNEPDLGYNNEAVQFRADLHYQGPLEVHHRIFGGYDTSDRIDAMAAIDIEQPLSLKNLPIIIISGLADENMPEWKKEELRHAWATMKVKNFLAFIRAYAISDLFHFGQRVFHPNVFTREVALAAKAVRSDSARYFYVNPNTGNAQRSLFAAISQAQGLLLFHPEKGVFGHRTGLADAGASTSYATHYNRFAQTRSYRDNQGIDWSPVIPPDINGGWTAESVARWLWNDFYPGRDADFNGLVRANLVAILAGYQDLAWLAASRGVSGISAEDDITEQMLATNDELSALVESLATTTIDLSNSTAENVVALAMNFIAATPYAFIDF